VASRSGWVCSYGCPGYDSVSYGVGVTSVMTGAA
jgi:hypothetical protein